MNRQPASIGKRFLAFLLDFLIIEALSAPLWFFGPFTYAFTFLLVVYFYYAVLEQTALCATIGKKACGIMVVDENGQRLSASASFLRSLCRLLSDMTLGVGHLIALFNPEGRTLHDRMAKTYVVSARDEYALSGNVAMSGETVCGSARPVLVCTSGVFAGQAFAVSKDGIIIGTDMSVANVVIPAQTPGVSRNHCKITFNYKTNTFVIHDLGSSYGTFLANGVRVGQGQPVAIMPNSAFYLASPALSFVVRI